MLLKEVGWWKWEKLVSSKCENGVSCSCCGPINTSTAHNSNTCCLPANYTFCLNQQLLMLSIEIFSTGFSITLLFTQYNWTYWTYKIMMSLCCSSYVTYWYSIFFLQSFLSFLVQFVTRKFASRHHKRSAWENPADNLTAKSNLHISLKFIFGFYTHDHSLFVPTL